MGGANSNIISRTDDASFFMHAGDPISQKSTRTSLVMYAHHKVVTDMAQWDLDMRACMRDLTGAGSVGASNSGTSSALTDVASCNVMMHWTLRPQADAATATGAHDDDDGHDAVRPRRRASTPAQAAPAAGTSRRVATSVARDSSPLQRGGPSTSTSSLTSASLSDTSGVEPVQSASGVPLAATIVPSGDPSKPHGCSACAYKAKKKVDLVRHIRTHTGERPH